VRSFFLLSALLIACGGKAVIDGEPSQSEGGGGSTSTSSSQGGSSSTSGGSVQSIGLERALAFANCFPGGGEQLTIEFTLSFENVSSQPATVELIEARLSGFAGQTNFEVAPASVTVSPMSTQQFQFETVGSGLGTLGCDWCNETNITLEVEMVIDGTMRSFSDEIDSVSCSF
jgi:hypothetical protein